MSHINNNEEGGEKSLNKLFNILPIDENRKRGLSINKNPQNVYILAFLQKKHNPLEWDTLTKSGTN